MMPNQENEKSSRESVVRWQMQFIHVDDGDVNHAPFAEAVVDWGGNRPDHGIASVYRADAEARYAPSAHVSEKMWPEYNKRRFFSPKARVKAAWAKLKKLSDKIDAWADQSVFHTGVVMLGGFFFLYLIFGVTMAVIYG